MGEFGKGGKKSRGKDIKWTRDHGGELRCGPPLGLQVEGKIRMGWAAIERAHERRAGNAYKKAFK